MSKRASGEGSIYRRKSDGRWVGSHPLGYVVGKRARKVVYGRTQGEVVEKLRRLRAEQGGIPLTPSGTLDEFFDQWLNVIEVSVAATTFANYESLLRVHVRPTLGQRRLENLRPLDVQTLLATLLRRGSSPRTVQYVHAVLRKALADAEQWEMIPRNPASNVRAPKVTRPIPRPLDRDEVERILDAIDRQWFALLFVVALGSGLRLGELLGLQWADLDQASGTLQVRRTRRRDGTIAEPKSAAGRREIDLHASLVAVLVQARTISPGPKCEMFLHTEGRPLLHRHVQQVWERTLRAANVEHRGFHQIRKTYASVLVESGIDVRTAQELLGHADVRMTLEVYARTSRGARQSAAHKIGEWLPPLALGSGSHAT
jgi:integrase